MTPASLVPSLALVAILVAAPAPVPALAPAPAGAVTAAASSWKIDPVHSSVLFKVKHLGVASFYGRFNDVSGTIVLDEASPEKGSIEVVVQVDSVDTHEPKRDQHLKSPDFFSAAEFPTITFKSKSVRQSGSDWSVTGDLTIHGVTQSVTTEFARTGTGPGMQKEMRTGGEATFTIQRSDFGMTFMLPDGVGDEVTLIISLEAVQG